MVTQTPEELAHMTASLRYKEAYDGLHHIRHVLFGTIAANFAVASVHVIGVMQTLFIIMCLGVLGCVFLHRGYLELERAGDELNEARRKLEEAAHDVH